MRQARAAPSPEIFHDGALAKALEQLPPIPAEGMHARSARPEFQGAPFSMPAEDAAAQIEDRLGRRFLRCAPDGLHHQTRTSPDRAINHRSRIRHQRAVLRQYRAGGRIRCNAQRAQKVALRVFIRLARIEQYDAFTRSQPCRQGHLPRHGPGRLLGAGCRAAPSLTP